MSWTKIIICDICGEQHKFFKEVSSERAFIQIHLRWKLILVGRSKYDVCGKCADNVNHRDLEKFFRENPVRNQETFHAMMDRLFVKGFNSK